MEEQVVESVRNAVGETKSGVGTRRLWTPCVDVAKGSETLEEALGTSGYRAGDKQLRTLKGR
jgi:hypothetical protein